MKTISRDNLDICRYSHTTCLLPHSLFRLGKLNVVLYTLNVSMWTEKHENKIHGRSSWRKIKSSSVLSILLECRVFFASTYWTAFAILYSFIIIVSRLVACGDKIKVYLGASSDSETRERWYIPTSQIGPQGLCIEI